MEDKVKKIGGELECQRHNAEAARQAMDQKMKDREKETRMEMSQQADIIKDFEKQLQDTKCKLLQDVNKVFLVINVNHVLVS